MPRCKFCQEEGHNISTCRDPSIREKILRVEGARNHGDLMYYLNWCNSTSLSVICAHYKLVTSGTIVEKTHRITSMWIRTHPSPTVTVVSPVVPVIAPVVPVTVSPVIAPVVPVTVSPVIAPVTVSPVVSREESDRMRLSNMLSDMSFSDDVATAVLASARVQSNQQATQLGRTLAHVATFDAPLANAIARAFPAHTQAPTPVAPRTRLVNLQTLVRLSSEPESDLVAYKREHEERIKRIGVQAYNKIRGAHAIMDRGLYQADQHDNRLRAFIVRKNEILTELRAMCNNSRSDYVIAMVEYNRLFLEFPLFVSVPDQSPVQQPVARPVARPVAAAAARQFQGQAVYEDDDDYDHDDYDHDDDIPIIGLRTVFRGQTPSQAPVQAPVQALAPAPAPVQVQVALPPYSSVIGKRHLRMLSIKVCVDSTLDIKEAKKKRGGAVVGAVVEEPENECQICTLAFSTKMAPKVRLNCGHETCANCIVTMAQGRTKHTLCCPFCRDGIVGCEIGTNFAMAKLNKALSKT